VKNVLVGLLGVVLLLVLVNSQDAEAAHMVCDDTVAGNSLPADAMYIGDEDGFLFKLDAAGADKGHQCKFAIEMKSGGMILKCFDIALDPTTGKLFCVFGSQLYEIDRGEPHLSPAAIGTLKDAGLTITLINALEFDHAGGMYAARASGPTCGATSGTFYDVDKTTAALTFRGNLGGRSSGDLIYDHIGDLVNGQMFWTSSCCPTTAPESCTAGNDGLYKIDLTVFPNVGTFITDIGHTDAFAADMLTSGNLCFVTNQGILFETDLTGTQMGSDILTSDFGELIKAFGGTGNQILVGGVKILIESTSLLLAGFEEISVWITSALFTGIGITAFMFINNNFEKRKKKY